MNIVLLSGGSGKRLWPLSNDIRSKQFIKIFKKDDGTFESMVQRMYRQIKKIDENAKITIATSKMQVSVIHNQLGNDVGISIEPYRRDTFPAIVLAAAYLKDIKGIGENEPVVVCPVDPYVNEDYFEALKALSNQAEEGTSNLVLMGIEPTYPSEKYGYIIPYDSSEFSKVENFEEKPTEEVARQYIKDGALWNGGVFAFKLSYLIRKSHEIINYTDYADLYSKYENLAKISFDYAVVEREKDIQVMRFAGEWKDLGTWNTLTEAMSDKVVGDAVMDESCKNVNIVNELDVPILAMGLSNVVISASPDGILVSDKDKSTELKKYTEALKDEARFAEKSWGSFRVIDANGDSLTIKVKIKAGDGMNYHSHVYRDEVWVVVSGKGRTVIDGIMQHVSVGDVITMKAGCRHTVFADTDLVIIEVQLGKEITINDKIKFQLEEDSHFY